MRMMIIYEHWMDKKEEEMRREKEFFFREIVNKQLNSDFMFSFPMSLSWKFINCLIFKARPTTNNNNNNNYQFSFYHHHHLSLFSQPPPKMQFENHWKYFKTSSYWFYMCMCVNVRMRMRWYIHSYIDDNTVNYTEIFSI